MILLDTHALIFWANNKKDLGNKALKAIKKSNRIGIHVISCFEIAVLVEKELIQLNRSVDRWIADALSHPKIEIVPLTVTVAIECTMLPGNFHRDPADRILAATCLANDYTLISKNRLINKWGYIETIW